MGRELPVINQPPPQVAAVLDHLTRRLRLPAEAVLARSGLRPRHLVALTVLRDGGEVTQQALAEILEIDRTNLVGLLNQLEAQGLVQRRRATEDRRRHIVVLTDPGRRRLAEAELALAAVEDVVLAALSTEERRQLHELLARAVSPAACGPSPAAPRGTPPP